MKRSLLALVLALIMCLSLFCTSCGTSDDEENPDVMDTDSEITPITLTLYAPTKGTTTQDQIDLVQEAFNAITQSKFNTNVILKLFPESEYDSVIKTTIENIHKQIEEEEAAEESRLEAEKEALLKGETLPSEETEAPETEAKDSNTESPEITYPAERENQLDIFLVNSFETYYDLAVAGELSPLEEEISANSKLLNSYVYPYMLRAAVVEGSTYGVFNNTVFGDYQYLLLNKELVDKYEYDPEEMNSLSDIELFLKEVKQNEADVIPFLGDIEAPVVYWNDTESLIGAFIGGEASSSGTIDATSYLPDPLAPNLLFSDTGYRQWVTSYNALYQAGCLVEETEQNKNAKFAAKVIEGDASLSPTYADVYGNYKVDKYGFKYITDENGVDYYVSVYKRPVAENKNVFNAGYVVSAYTEDVARCMEIITALNTDATLSNLFMYGVEDLHYTIDEDTGLVHKTATTYAMDISTIGNIYLLTPSDDMDEYWTSMSANGWLNVKNANREAIMSPFLGYYYNPEKPLPEDLEEGKIMIDMTFEELMAELVKQSGAYFDKVMTYRDTDGVSFSDYLTSLRTELNANADFEALTDYKTGIYYSVTPYEDWYEEHYGVSLDN